MNVETGAESALFPEKEYINGIFVTVCPKFDMVWQYCSPIAVGRRGVISSFKWFLPASPRQGGGGASQQPVITMSLMDFLDPKPNPFDNLPTMSLLAVERPHCWPHCWPLCRLIRRSLPEEGLQRPPPSPALCLLQLPGGFLPPHR